MRDILERVQAGRLGIEQAIEEIKKTSYAEMGFAKLDTDRKSRQGFAEVVYCDGKADEHLLSIFTKIYEAEGEVLGTRANRHQYEFLKGSLPKLTYDSQSRILKIESSNKSHKGRIAICTAGTADIAVAEEAAQTVEFFDGKADRFYDIGISGLHRLIDKIPEICAANCVIAIAGMEGALPSVLGGLVERPVIAVPTSVGYGANLNGLSALLTMINSCANGIAVVNIDNGYGAAYLATQINRLAIS